MGRCIAHGEAGHACWYRDLSRASIVSHAIAKHRIRQYVVEVSACCGRVASEADRIALCRAGWVAQVHCVNQISAFYLAVVTHADGWDGIVIADGAGTG